MDTLKVTFSCNLTNAVLQPDRRRRSERSLFEQSPSAARQPVPTPAVPPRRTGGIITSHLRMFINDLGVAGGGRRCAVNAIRWHTADGGSAQREAGEAEDTRRLVDIHINGELGLCSAAMSPS